MKLKKFNSFLNESDERYSEVTEYGNSAMEHNNVYLKEIQDGLDAIETDYIDQIITEQDDLDSNESLVEDTELLENNKEEIRSMLSDLRGLVDDSINITEKYMSDVDNDNKIENTMSKIKDNSWKTGNPDKSGKYVGEDYNYYIFDEEDDTWTYDGIAHDGPRKWIPVF